MADDIYAVEAYKYVLADLKQAVGFRKKSIKQARSMLKQRLWELEEIWSIPDILWNAFEEEEPKNG